MSAKVAPCYMHPLPKKPGKRTSRVALAVMDAHRVLGVQFGHQRWCQRFGASRRAWERFKEDAALEGCPLERVNTRGNHVEVRILKATRLWYEAVFQRVDAYYAGCHDCGAEINYDKLTTVCHTCRKKRYMEKRA